MTPDMWTLLTIVGTGIALAARVKSPVEGAAGSCSSSARSEEDGDPGDLLLAKEKANDKADDCKCPSPKGCEEKIRAASARLRGEQGVAFLLRSRVTPSDPARNAAYVTFAAGC